MMNEWLATLSNADRGALFVLTVFGFVTLAFLFSARSDIKDLLSGFLKRKKRDWGYHRRGARHAVDDSRWQSWSKQKWPNLDTPYRDVQWWLRDEEADEDNAERAREYWMKWKRKFIGGKHNA